MSQAAITVESLSKKYRLGSTFTRDTTFRDLLTGMALAPLRRILYDGDHGRRHEDFWALSEISFEIQQGEVVGIIGRNGAGKSTLLKILSRIVEPTRGQATLRGRVASLLEVGTGFHPELTGRENIYLNGSILGMKRQEINARFDEIVSFAEIEKFLDTPVKRYSSGMYVRLAFAVAAHLNPEILIVDEVLAVGDAEFQKKCLGKMSEVAKRGSGRTVLFVSHNMAAVSSLCGRALVLAKGRLIADTLPAEAIRLYTVPARANSTSKQNLQEHPGRVVGSVPCLVAVRLLNECNREAETFTPLEQITIEIRVEFDRTMRAPRVGIGVDNWRGDRVFALATFLSPAPLGRVETGPATIRAMFTLPALYPGDYDFDISLADADGLFLDRVERAGTISVREDGFLGSATPYFPQMGIVLVRSEWSAITPAQVPGTQGMAQV